MTVAVLDPQTQDSFEITDGDLKIEWYSGTGKGGQHRNKHQNSCRITHIPTGLQESRQGRQREANLRDAKEALQRRLHGAAKESAHEQTAADRKSQVGSGMRGDKTVTIRFQDDRVQHHLTGKTMSAKKYMKGHMSELWS